MAMEDLNGLMEALLMVRLRITSFVDMELIYERMEEDILVNESITKKKGMAFLLGKMGENTKESL